MAWHPRLSTLQIVDATGTPLDVDVANEDGDFSVDGLIQGNTQLEALYDRGAFDQLIATQDVQITGSFSYRVGDWASSTDRAIDAAMKIGAFASAVSTHSSGDGVLYTVNWTTVKSGSTYKLALAKCLFTTAISEGSPAATTTLSFICYGGATFTKT